jgi:hypothetical protein
VKGKSLIGPAITILWGVIAIIIEFNAALETLAIFPSANFFMLPSFNYFIFSLIGLILGILSLLGKSIINYSIIVWGILGLIGLFFVPLPPPPIPFYHYVLFWIIPIVIIIGGVIGLVIKEE